MFKSLLLSFIIIISFIISVKSAIVMCKPTYWRGGNGFDAGYYCHDNTGFCSYYGGVCRALPGGADVGCNCYGVYRRRMGEESIYEEDGHPASRLIDDPKYQQQFEKIDYE
eukprot:158411_1